MNDTIEKIKDNLQNFMFGINAAIQKNIYDETGIFEPATSKKIRSKTNKDDLIRICPFCKKNYEDSEHILLTEHMLDLHPLDTLLKYKKDLLGILKNPTEISPRYVNLFGPFKSFNNIFGPGGSFPEDESTCPFCDITYKTKSLARHVRSEHGVIAEILNELR